MTDAKIVAEKLLQVNAVQLNPQQPYTWASGWKSPIYCDNRRILSFPFIRDFIKSDLCNIIFDKFPDAGLIAGVATAGIPWGAMVADQLKLPFAYVRPKPKEHGMGNQIEGFIEDGATAVVVEDLVSTGKSSLQAVDALEHASVKVVGMVSVFSYGFEVATQALTARKLPFFSLTDYPALLSIAKEKNQISEADEQALLQWRQAPEIWQGL